MLVGIVIWTAAAVATARSAPPADRASTKVGTYHLGHGSDGLDACHFALQRRFLDEEHGVLDAELPHGGTWFAADGPAEGGALARLVLGHGVAARGRPGTGVLCRSSASDGTHLVLASDLRLDSAYAPAMPALCAWQRRLGCAPDAEPAARAAGHVTAYPVLTTALEVVTMRHSLGLVLTNLERIIARGVVANTHPASRDLIVGVTVTRGFRL